jgi:3-oxoacyl-[acyl-carrier protein] reductase
MLDQGAVLVTGAAVGIGRAIAEAFARQGDPVVIADVDVEGAERTAHDFVEQGWDATAAGMDVTDVPQVRSVVAALDAARPLRAVVANAGVAFQRPTEDVEPDEFDRLMAVNVRGVFFVMQAALRCMLPRESGSIVAISSTSGFTASTGQMVAYDASKAAVRMLVSATAKEVAARGVRVNAVAPGTVETDLTRALATQDQLARLASTRVPMGRLGLPREIADACVFLASDAASYVTGHTLVVDGGWLA